MPETQMEVTNNLYEFLQQWYTLFPMYQASEAHFLLLVMADSFPEQPLLSLWRVLCRQIRALPDPTHSRKEPGGQRQDPVSKDWLINYMFCQDQSGWYGNWRWVDVTLPQCSLRQLPLPGQVLTIFYQNIGAKMDMTDT